MDNNSMALTGIGSADVAKLRAQQQMQAAKTQNAANAANMAQVDKAAQEFESVFLSQMLQHMFDGVETNDLFGGGHGEDVYRSFMVDEYAKLITKTGGVGVADHVKAEMLRMQEMGAQVPSLTAAGM